MTYLQEFTLSVIVLTYTRWSLDRVMVGLVELASIEDQLKWTSSITAYPYLLIQI